MWLPTATLQALFVLDTVFTVCFTVEILMQAVAHCFVLGPYAYLHDGWNWIGARGVQAAGGSARRGCRTGAVDGPPRCQWTQPPNARRSADAFVLCW